MGNEKRKRKNEHIRSHGEEEAAPHRNSKRPRLTVVLGREEKSRVSIINVQQNRRRRWRSRRRRGSRLESVSAPTEHAPRGNSESARYARQSSGRRQDEIRRARRRDRFYRQDGPVPQHVRRARSIGLRSRRTRSDEAERNARTVVQGVLHRRDFSRQRKLGEFGGRVRPRRE